MKNELLELLRCPKTDQRLVLDQAGGDDQDTKPVCLISVHGKFDESFRIVGDYELLLRELKNGHATFVPTVVGMQCGGVSSDPSYSLTSIARNRRCREKI